MSQTTQPPKASIIKLIILPVFCAIILISTTIWGNSLAKGNDLVAILKFSHYFQYVMIAVFLMIICSIVITVSQVNFGDTQNLLVFLNLGVMFGLIGMMIFGFTSWNKKPNAALDAINLQLQPVVEELFSQDSIRSIETNQSPMTPFALVEVEVNFNAEGDYLFTKPTEGDTELIQDINTYAQKLILLERYQEGGIPESYRSIVAISRQWIATGRNIRLDVGSVPELRQRVSLYIIDVSSWQVGTVIGPILGSKAHAPFRAPGAGTIYISELRGKVVDLKTIQKYLNKLDWE